jgi:hypothetical protein
MAQFHGNLGVSEMLELSITEMERSLEMSIGNISLQCVCVCGGVVSFQNITGNIAESNLMCPSKFSLISALQ